MRTVQAGLCTDFTMSSSILVEERGSVFCVGAGVVMPTFMGLPAPRVGWMDTGTGTGTGQFLVWSGLVNSLGCRGFYLSGWSGLGTGDVMPAVEWIVAGLGMFPLNGWFVLFLE